MHLDNRKAKEIVFYSDFSLLLTAPPSLIPWGGRVSIIIPVRLLMRPFPFFYCCEAATAQQLCLSAGGALLERNTRGVNVGRNLEFVRGLGGNVHAHLLVKTSRPPSN